MLTYNIYNTPEIGEVSCSPGGRSDPELGGGLREFTVSGRACGRASERAIGISDSVYRSI